MIIITYMHLWQITHIYIILILVKNIKNVNIHIYAGFFLAFR
jgi:hypothetical protein